MSKHHRAPDDGWLITTRAKRPRKAVRDVAVGPALPTLPPELRLLIWAKLGVVDAARLSQVCHRLWVELQPYRVPRPWVARGSLFERASSLRPQQVQVLDRAVQLDLPRSRLRPRWINAFERPRVPGAPWSICLDLDVTKQGGHMITVTAAETTVFELNANGVGYEACPLERGLADIRRFVAQDGRS
jgi:hypothetical protein